MTDKTTDCGSVAIGAVRDALRMMETLRPLSKGEADRVTDVLRTAVTAMESGSNGQAEERSVLEKASEYEAGRGFVLPHHEDACLLLYSIEDKPHRAIKYISEWIESHRKDAVAQTTECRSVADEEVSGCGIASRPDGADLWVVVDAHDVVYVMRNEKEARDHAAEWDGEDAMDAPHEVRRYVLATEQKSVAETVIKLMESGIDVSWEGHPGDWRANVEGYMAEHESLPQAILMAAKKMKMEEKSKGHEEGD